MRWGLVRSQSSPSSHNVYMRGVFTLWRKVRGVDGGMGERILYLIREWLGGGKEMRVCVCLNKCVYAAITQTCPHISITIQVSTCTEREMGWVYIGR